jgi:lactoylglutathione lyase
MARLTALVVALTSAALLAQGPPARPRILGIAHLAVLVTHLPSARAFYEDLLGFDESFTLPGAGSASGTTWIKINDRQWIELIDGETAGEGQLDHIALYTGSAAGMRDYLASQGVQVPDRVDIGPTGDTNFVVRDPDRHDVEFVEYQPGSRTAADTGQHMAETRLSARAMHVGILAADLDAAMKFYGGILGFEETWRGASAASRTLSWVNIRVPDGNDYLELMLYERMPAPGNRGSAHHLCLLVEDAQDAVKVLESRAPKSGYTRPVTIRTGINRKRQVNLFDPDGTRVELMEPDTTGGRPAPSSTLPPPR